MLLDNKFLNPLHSVWTPEDYQQHKLRVIEGEEVKIAISPSPQPKTEALNPIREWRHQVASGVKYWAGLEKDRSSLYIVSSALDRLALQLLKQEVNQWITVFKKPNLDHRIELLQQSNTRLRNLVLNLKNHDQIIHSFNQRFLLKDRFISCPSHHEISVQIEGQCMTLSKIIQHLQKQKENHSLDRATFFTSIQELEKNLENGLQMTKELLMTSYSLLLKQAQRLNIKPEVIESINRLFNQNYIQFLLNHLSAETPPLPASIEYFIAFLGIPKENAAQKIAAGRETFIQKLRSYRNQQSLTQSPLILADTIQKDFITIAGEQLTTASPLQSSFKQILEKLYLFEIKMNVIMMKSEREVRKKLDQTIEELSIQTEHQIREKEILTDQWKRVRFPSLIPQVMQFLLQQLMLDAADIQSPQAIEQALEKLEMAIAVVEKDWTPEKFTQSYSDLAEETLITLAEEAGQIAQLTSWQERNAKQQCFSFDQYSWGDQQVFGEGVCTAINYRWIRHLIDHPEQPIRSSNDLDDNASDRREDSLFRKEENGIDHHQNSGVTPKDRITQARYQIESLLRATDTQKGVGYSVLKRDGMQYQMLEKGRQNIEDLIDRIIEKHEDNLRSPSTRGTIDIGMFIYDPITTTFSAGHTIGMQIDLSRSIYRFWDVHSGFYQYSSLEHLKKEFKDYLQECYVGKYNYFQAGQYSKKSF